MHKHLTRLERVWVEAPIYFLTACTEKRRKVLARDSAVEILVDEWRAAHARHGWLVGRYVVMPDHVHFFLYAGERCEASFRFYWCLEAMDESTNQSARRAGDSVPGYNGRP